MTKEELKQEAEEKLLQAELDYCHGFMNPCEPNELPYIELVRFRTGFERGYLAGAEPREKRIAELIDLIHAERKRQEQCDDIHLKKIAELEKENAELRKVAEFQQSSNMNTHLENKKLKEGLAVGSTWNKYLNSLNKTLEEERDKYREMTFDMKDQLTKAKELLERLLITSCNSDVLNLLPNCSEVLRVRVEAEQFLSDIKEG